MWKKIDLTFVCFEKLSLLFLETQLYFYNVYDIFANIMMLMTSMCLCQNGPAKIPCKYAYG